jgi:uncharacterized protein (DUF1778 family)
MIQVQDYTAHVSERKTTRKELKLKPSVDEKIKWAAQMVGMDASTFIASAAYEKAQDVEKSQFVTVLKQTQFDAFAKAVDTKGKRNEALSEVIKKSREMFVDG